MPVAGRSLPDLPLRRGPDRWAATVTSPAPADGPASGPAPGPSRRGDPRHDGSWQRARPQGDLSALCAQAGSRRPPGGVRSGRCSRHDDPPTAPAGCRVARPDPPLTLLDAAARRPSCRALAALSRGGALPPRCAPGPTSRVRAGVDAAVSSGRRRAGEPGRQPAAGRIRGAPARGRCPGVGPAVRGGAPVRCARAGVGRRTPGRGPARPGRLPRAVPRTGCTDVRRTGRAARGRGGHPPGRAAHQPGAGRRRRAGRDGVVAAGSVDRACGGGQGNRGGQATARRANHCAARDPACTGACAGASAT